MLSVGPTAIGAVNDVNGGTGKPAASLTTSECTPSPAAPVWVASASPMAVAIWATVSATMESCIASISVSPGGVPSIIATTLPMSALTKRVTKAIPLDGILVRVATTSGSTLIDPSALSVVGEPAVAPIPASVENAPVAAANIASASGCNESFCTGNYSSSSTTDAICTATRSLLTPGYTRYFSRSLTFISSGSFTGLSNNTTSPT